MTGTEFRWCFCVSAESCLWDGVVTMALLSLQALLLTESKLSCLLYPFTPSSVFFLLMFVTVSNMACDQ